MMLSVLQFHGDDYSGIVEVLWQWDAGLRAHKDFFSWAQGLWCDKYTKDSKAQDEMIKWS